MSTTVMQSSAQSWLPFPLWTVWLLISIGIVLIVASLAYDYGRKTVEREHRIADLERRMRELEKKERVR